MHLTPIEKLLQFIKDNYREGYDNALTKEISKMQKYEKQYLEEIKDEYFNKGQLSTYLL